MTLQGFKSFGNRAVLEFAPGITAIVGPNGSGKSNVIDALKWTTGGGRASTFRADDKTDLIFHGAVGKRGVSLAEVEIELVGKHQKMKLYRSLDKDGTTRLRLNGKSARFLDMEEALAGSGLGRSGLAVIGQGEIGQVLMADPERLLEYVAESAGAARLSARRDQTQARLDTAKQHLERLADVLRELEDRAAALTTEAADAQKHAELSAEALMLSFTAASLRKEGYEAEIQALLLRAAGLEEALAEGRVAFGTYRKDIEEARVVRSQAEEKLRAAVALLELRRGDLRVAAETKRRLDEGLEALRRQQTAMTAEVTTLAALNEPVPPTSSQASADAAVDLARVAADASGLTLERAQAEEQRIASRLRLSRERVLAHERAVAAHESRQQGLVEQREAYSQRLEQLADGQETADLDQLEAAAASATSSATAAGDALEAARRSVAEEQRVHALAAAEATARARAAERAREAFESRRGYSHGPRAALTAPVKGVIGSVADLFKPEPRFQTAVAAALGRRAEYVVVEDSGVAKRVLEHVRASGGYVTLLPLDLLRVPNYPAPNTNAAGVMSAAVDAISFDPRFSRVAEMLLGGTLIVDTLDSATDLARKPGARSRLVTLDGDLVEPSGAMSGGKRNQQAGVLGAAADLEEAEEAARAATGEAQMRGERLAEAQARLAAAQRAASEAGSRQEETRLAWSSAVNETATRERLLQEVRTRLAAVEVELAGLVAPVPEGETGSEPSESDHVEALARLEAARSERNAAVAAFAEARHAAQILAQAWSAHAVELERFKTAQARSAQLSNELAALKTRESDLHGESEAAAKAQAAAEAAVPAGVQVEEQAAKAASDRLTELERALSRLNDVHADRAGELEEVRVALARREASLELAVEELSGFPPGVPRADLSERAARTRLREVNEALEALGAVNHRAKADLTEVTERKELIEVETVQAALALTELETSLERIDKETTARLTAELDRLKTAFARQVQHLFGEGGSGSIEVNSEAGRPVGVRISLTPPGKQTQSLQLLSVGERTMGALAFLFALMASPDGGGGLPVAVLDEVDAPLDEANIRRFCTFVSRLAKHGTQFVLITHQKATFEVADTLWGITTEQGVSRVFSMRREEEVAV